MESPAKRQRLDRPWESDDDDDLSFQPQEASARRDPGYQLSVQRAYADNRFMSTMAHIFDKYGRDFEGVGDEIDMMTGEIVVNNGHLKNMRDEGDVGTGQTSGARDEEEDEHDDEEEEGGIRLEDLLGSSDDEDDEDDRDDDAPKDVGVDEEEEYRVMQGPDSQATSTVLVPHQAERTIATAPRPPSFGQDPFNSMNAFGPPGMLFGGPNMSFGASPLGFGASPLSFGHSPLAFNPWGQHLPQPTMWDAPDISHQQAAANRVALQPQQQRRSRTSSVRGASIWSGGTAYEYRQRASRQFARTIKPRPGIAMKPRPKKFPRATKMSSGANETAGDDEDAILTGRSGPKEKRHDHREIQDSDDEGSLPSPPRREPLQDSRNHGNDKSPEHAKPARGKRRSRTLKRKFDFEDLYQPDPVPIELAVRSRTSCSATIVANGFPAVGEPVNAEGIKDTDAEADSGSRRRSGRDRKQVEFLSQLRWPPVGKGKAKMLRLAAEQAAAKQAAEGNDTLFVQGEGGNTSAKQTASTTRYPQSTSGERVVPDSQDSATPPSSSIPTLDKSKQFNPGRLSKDVVDMDSGCVLSDDEMPMQVRHPRPVSTTEASYANLLFRPIEKHDTKKKTRSKRRSGRSKPSDAALDVMADCASAPETQAPARKRSYTRRRSHKTVPNSSMSDPLPEKESAAEMSSPREDMRLVSSGRPRSQPSGSVNVKSDRRRSSRNTRSNPIGRSAAEEAANRGARPRKIPKELRWLLENQKGDSSESDSADDEGADEEADEEATRENHAEVEKAYAVAGQTETNKDGEPTADSDHPAEASGALQDGDNTNAPESAISSKPESNHVLPSAKDQQPPRTSPVVEETDQGEDDEPSSAPVRFGSPELGSFPDPYDLPRSPIAPPRRISPAKGSPAKPSPLRKAQMTSTGDTSPTRRKSVSPTKLTSPSKVTKAATPRTPRSHSVSPRKNRTPSSRRSLLSLSKPTTRLGDVVGDDDDDDDLDELGAAVLDTSINNSTNRRASISRRIWKATPRTTEVYLHSPVRRESGRGEGGQDPGGSPGEKTRTPGGTIRTCGVDGFRCGRDFCFTCL